MRLQNLECLIRLTHPGAVVYAETIEHLEERGFFVKRESGILLHPSSLGGFAGAKRWIDFLADAGVSVWQILPLGPVGLGNSPYQSPSAWAGEPSLATPCYDETGLDDFVAHESGWLPDYALFMALRERFGAPWQTWDEPLRMRDRDTLERYHKELAVPIRAICREQMHFFRQWNAIHAYANSRGVEILGDLPIYVAEDSVDVWCNPWLFRKDAVAGCPPDGFCADGQLWGNPLYDWNKLKETGYDWWLWRLRHTLRMVDRVRIDHFRAFDAYWAVPKSAPTARDGHWEDGPGLSFFRAVWSALGDVSIVAEDLGFLTPRVHALRESAGLPGMLVLQFAWSQGSAYLPHNHRENAVVYTGTHDNDTTRGWADSHPDEAAFARSYLGCEDILDGMLRAAWRSPARLAVAPMQDFLGLGSEARMNTPGTVGGNWDWQMNLDALTPALAAHIRVMNELYERN